MSFFQGAKQQMEAEPGGLDVSRWWTTTSTSPTRKKRPRELFVSCSQEKQRGRRETYATARAWMPTSGATVSFAAKALEPHVFALAKSPLES